MNPATGDFRRSTSTLLQEAIADAKAVRATALANLTKGDPYGYYTKSSWEMTHGIPICKCSYCASRFREETFKCSYCGSRFKEDNFKCPNCGASI